MYHKTKPDGGPNDGWAESLAIMGVLEDLLVFIDSLPDEKPSEDLKEAADEYAISLTPCDQQEELNYFNSFIAGAEWMRSQMPLPEDTVIFMKGVAEGRRLEREEMEENKKKENDLPRYYGD